MDKKIEACARAAHEVNRAYCLAIGDDSQPSWESAPEWQRSSALKGVVGALAGNTPEQSHEGWLPEQRKKDMLFLSAVRGMAAALGMSVTYPASPARPEQDGLPAMPAFPRRTIDYSLAPRQD